MDYNAKWGIYSENSIDKAITVAPSPTETAHCPADETNRRICKQSFKQQGVFAFSVTVSLCKSWDVRSMPFAEHKHVWLDVKHWSAVEQVKATNKDWQQLRAAVGKLSKLKKKSLD